VIGWFCSIRVAPRGRSTCSKCGRSASSALGGRAPAIDFEWWMGLGAALQRPRVAFLAMRRERESLSVAVSRTVQAMAAYTVDRQLVSYDSYTKARQFSFYLS
jgi:hypothetical protein